MRFYAVLVAGRLGASNQYIELSQCVERLKGAQIEVLEVFPYARYEPLG